MNSNTEDLIDTAAKFITLPFLGGIMGITSIFLNIVMDMIIAIPFWLCWTVFGVGAKYFSFLPITYQNISLWYCMGIFVCLGLLKMICFSKNINVNTKE
jgi:hypothetical protein